MGTGVSKGSSSAYSGAKEPIKMENSKEPIKIDNKPNLYTDHVPSNKTYETPELGDKKKILTKRVNFLDTCADYCSHECLSALTDINHAYRCVKGDEERSPLGDHLAEVGFADVFLKMWKELTKEDLMVEEQNSRALKVYNKLKGVIHNFSDVSALLCEELGKSGAVAALLSELNYQELNYKKIDEEEGNDGMRRRWIKSTLGILHNTIRMCADNVPIFREAGAVDLLTEYLKCTYLIVRAKALLNLVYIVDEDENDKIMTGGTNISFLVKMLESALESDDHMSKMYYFDVEELVDGLNKLAQNDANKVTLVNSGILPLLVKLMKESKTEEEMRLVGRCIWTLAFSDENKHKIRNEPELMEEMMKHRHCKNPKKCGGACKAIRGGLWVLGEKNVVKESEQLESDSSKKDDGQDVQSREKSVGHVMISYQWDVQKTIIKIKDQLKAKGYKVWMDIEQMEGSTLEAMASAVENASVVLICYTQKYKDSPSCRTEAEYTYRLQKPFVPLKIQQNYQPDGWLGILLGTKLYFDFSSPSKLDQEMPKLVKELGKRGLASSPPPLIKRQSVIKGVTVTAVGSAPPEVLVPVNGTAGWTNSDVNKWLNGIELGHLVKKFTEYNGEMLVGLKLVASESPDFFYSSLKSDLGFQKLVDIIRFRSALEKLP
ncbi:uncharacterized protein [Ptychodera flava]|uniref:uncharacterized protein n=1 Tax=Ptychodera flava TaxID=63121 RepID=UPI00396A72A6